MSVLLFFLEWVKVEWKLILYVCRQCVIKMFYAQFSNFLIGIIIISEFSLSRTRDSVRDVRSTSGRDGRIAASFLGARAGK